MGELPARLAPSLNEPLEMFDACHRTIRKQLQTIWRVVEHVPRHGADEAARKAAMDVLRYFSTAGFNHHEDEERDLFPAVLGAVARSERRQTKALIDRLIDDHRRMAGIRERVLEKLLLVTQGKIPEFNVQEVESFASLYLEHMRIEHEELLPLARSVLSAEQIHSLSVTMSVRRGLGLEELSHTRF